MSEFFIGKTCSELKNLENLKKNSPGMYPFVEFFVLNRAGKTIGTALNWFSLATYTFFTGLFSFQLYNAVKCGHEYGQWIFPTAISSLMTGVLAYGAHKDYSDAAEKRLKLHALNRMIIIAQKFEKLCTQYGVETQFKLSEIKDDQGITLIKKLKHSRYRYRKTYLFDFPQVHIFLYRVYQQDKFLAQIFATIAEMDAYYAIAAKIIESRDQKNKFCFVDFIDRETPYISGQEFWNVLVEDPVPSSMSEGKNIILTGPNAGGKTTTIRAILQNIILAQSFGVAAATKFEFTMFDLIYSFLNVSDDLLNGLSLFASEVKRAQELLQKVKTLDKNEKLFFALDELFTGTAAQDGEICAYKFIEKMASFKGVQFIYATHFDKLKQLGAKSNYCVNYKVDAATKDSRGKLLYPYTMSKGANQTRVALDIAKEANLFD